MNGGEQGLGLALPHALHRLCNVETQFVASALGVQKRSGCHREPPILTTTRSAIEGPRYGFRAYILSGLEALDHEGSE